MEFLGIESLIDIGKNKKYSIEKKIKNLAKRYANNFQKYKLSHIPLIIGTEKFPDKKKSHLWMDFEEKNWFVPKYIFYKENKKYFFVINLFKDEKDWKNIGNEIKKLLGTNSSDELENNFIMSLTNVKSKSQLKQNVNDWKNKVNFILKNIHKGKIEKIVLSRQVDYKLNVKPSLSFLVQKLNEKYPENYCFLFKKSKSIFFGASPERLVKIKNSIIQTEALAGSIIRGKNTNEDKYLEKELLKSNKNIFEQKAVVDFIIDRLKFIATQIKLNKKPKIKKLTHIQHLFTKINAKLKDNISITSIIKNLHPTPAICGIPSNEALKIISKLEEQERGLYSGVIGWFNFNNEGEFAVAIRSALIKNKKLFTFSGCGIVSGSNPEEEFLESELKLKTIISLFQRQ
ncbi:MAG: chorismate-binding protein [Ignavibacteriales bacterium]|nr:chorismate-binding protein [Ignavibacteriales bacterium]